MTPFRRTRDAEEPKKPSIGAKPTVSADGGGVAVGGYSHHNAIGDGSKVNDQRGATNSIIVEPGATLINQFAATTPAADDEAWVPQSRAALLSPLRRTVRVTGRDGDLEQLVNWCTNRDGRHPADVRFRLITGPGGVGKSRLAEELKHQLAALPHEDGPPWASITVQRGDEAEHHRASKHRTRHPNQPLLIVVDYAETRPRLKKLLEDAYRTSGTVRVLLLARTAGRWWQELERLPGDIGSLVADGYDQTDLADADVEPQELFDVAVQDFARELNAPVPATRAWAAVPRGTGARALDVTARALVTVLRGEQNNGDSEDQPVGSLPIGEVLDELLRHEDAYWTDKAHRLNLALELDPRMRKMIIAAAALLGADTKPQALAAVRRAGEALADQPEIVLPPEDKAAGWLKAVYPPPPGETRWALPLQPDRLSEHLVVTALTPREPVHAEQAQAALLDRLTIREAPHAVTVLARAVTDPARTDEQAADIRRFADRIVRNLPDTWSDYRAMRQAVLNPDPRLNPTQLLLTQRQRDHAKQYQLGLEKRAIADYEFGTVLAWARRFEEAVEVEGKAVTLWRELYEQNPAKYRADYADALHNYGISLSETGMEEKALGPKNEALSLEEAAQETEARPWKLAETLHNVAHSLQGMGRHEEAEVKFREACELWKNLYEQDSDRYRFSFAFCLYNLGLPLSSVGRYEEAEEVEREAVALFKVLYKKNPDTYAAYLVKAQNNLGFSLKMQGRPVELVTVEMFTVMYEQFPHDHWPSLVQAWNNLGSSLQEQGREEEALRAFSEAVKIRLREQPNFLSNIARRDRYL